MKTFDAIVIGGGPAGMTAALYLLRNGKSVLVIEKNGFGGQITHSPKVENFPGFLSASGNEIADRMLDQILNQGAEIEFETVSSVEDDGVYKSVFTEEGSKFVGKTIIIAVGVKHRMLGLDNEEKLIGNGISFCAVCDGDFFSGKKVCVAGGGNSALQEAILLAGKCEEVTILQDLPRLTGEEKLQNALKTFDNVRVFTNQRIREYLVNNGDFSGVITEDKVSGAVFTHECDGLFLAIGLIPENKIFQGFADLDQFGYFSSLEDCLTKTSGVFVAGDCRSKRVRQLTTACADGAVAALAACNYLNAI